MDQGQLGIRRDDAYIDASPSPGGARRGLSVGTKLAGGTILLMFLVTLVLYQRLSAYQRENLLSAKEAAAAAVTRLFADSCAAPIVFGDDGALRDALAHLGRGDQIPFAAVWAVSGSRVASVSLARLGQGERVTVAAVPAALEVQREPERLVVLAPVRDLDANLVGVTAVAFSLARENALIAEVRSRTLLISAATAAGLTLLLLAIARFAIVRPLGKLVVAANAIERGVASNIDVTSHDEIGQLAAAFRSMAGAIANREERINARNRDMRLVLDNVGQGFLTLDIDSHVSRERSRVVHEWFGDPEDGIRFWDYIGRVDPKAGERFEVGWMLVANAIIPLEFSLDQLPKIIHGADRVLELAYRPITEGGALKQVLVVITDVTSRVEGERALALQRETMAIFQQILSDRRAFEEFFEEASSLVRVILELGSEPSQVRRALHTLKGNAGVYGIESISALCHSMESHLDEPERQLSAGHKHELGVQWARIGAVISQFTQDDSLTVPIEEHRALVAALEPWAPEDLVARLASWRFDPASSRLALLGKQTMMLAQRIGKPNVCLKVAPSSLRLPPMKWAPLWASLGHLLRNAIDHGVESSEERLRAGKPADATVSLSLTQVEREVALEVRDDGRGVDWESIAEHARALGVPVDTRQELEAALFVQGVSSRDQVTLTSGRGVGLDAVREVVRALGGRLVFESEPALGTRVTIYLPDSMLKLDAPVPGGSSAPRHKGPVRSVAAPPSGAAG